jgi:hypothetical protein
MGIRQHNLKILKQLQFFHRRNVRNIDHSRYRICLSHSVPASFQLLVEIISWSVDEERENRASLNPRIAIVVVE